MIATTRQKAKFKSLVRAVRNVLGAVPVDVETIAIGLLERLWHAAATDAFRGDIGKLSNDEIAEAIGWYGDADQIIEILVAARWLDKHDQCRLVVHDWHEHAPKYVKGNAEKYGGFIQGDSLKETPTGDSPDDPSRARAAFLAKPILAKPSLSNSAAASGDAAAFLNSADLEEVRIAANKLRHAWPAGDREFVWQVAYVATCINIGLCCDWASKIKARDVRKPLGYLNQALRKECEVFGLQWDALRVMVPKAPPAKETVEA
jgi:hypothetical protein